MENIEYNIADLLKQNQFIVKNEDVFSSNYVPEHFFHRKEELRLLTNHFRSIIYRNSLHTGKQIIIHGSVGLGKTAVVKKFGRALENFCKNNSDEKITNIIYFHINCRCQRSWHLILTSILRSLVPAFPVRGFSTNELLTFLNTFLEEKQQNILICLDEIDYLVSELKEQDVLYSMIRQNEGADNHQYAQISLILITRNISFLKYLDRTVLSSLSNKLLSFKPYTLLQLIDILKDRARKGLHDDTYTNDIIKGIASIAFEQSDTRYAIELLWRSAKMAEECGAKQIEFNHVRKAQITVTPFKRSLITELSIQQKCILLALSLLIIKEPERASILSKALKQKYEEVCLDKHVLPRKNTQFWNYLQQLINLKLIKKEVKNIHQDNKSLGRISYISTLEIPAKDIIEALGEDKVF